ncbi:TPA: hypothetical protein ACGO8M_000491 [Streptococcus suis]
MFLIGGKRYTEDEVDFLWLAIEDKESSYEDVADFFGRTANGVNYKVQRMTAKSGKGGLIGRHWSVEEKEKLRKLYPILPMESLLEIFKRNRNAITLQASRLGVHKKNCIFRNEAEIRKLANRGLTYREIAERTGGTVHSLRCYASKYGIKVRHEPRNKDHPWIKDTEIMFAIKKHWRKEHLEETDERH